MSCICFVVASTSPYWVFSESHYDLSIVKMNMTFRGLQSHLETCLHDQGPVHDWGSLLPLPDPRPMNHTVRILPSSAIVIQRTLLFHTEGERLNFLHKSVLKVFITIQLRLFQFDNFLLRNIIKNCGALTIISGIRAKRGNFLGMTWRPCSGHRKYMNSRLNTFKLKCINQS